MKKYIITEGQLEHMIGYMQELIFIYMDEDADSATHPLEIGFLDGLIEVKTKQRKYSATDLQNRTQYNHPGRPRADDSLEKIKYEPFTKGNSRQRQDQRRYKKLGLCVTCQKPKWELSNSFCEKHHIARREWARKYTGAKKRYKICKSYQGDNNG